MFKKLLISTLGLSLVLFSHASLAGKKALPAEKVKEIVEARFQGLFISNITPSKFDGFYAAEVGGEVIHISDDGRYFLQGVVFDMESNTNLNRAQKDAWDKVKSPMRKAEIAKLSEKDMVVFKAADEKHVITVFTDIDCGYCQKLHKERQNYLDRGITIRYLAFPRAGLQSPSADKLRGIWCSADPKEAMTNAKVRRKYENGFCETPFNDHMKLVRKFGLGGTPGIILENGDLIGGYQPAEVMITRLDMSKNQSKQASKP